MPVTWRGSVATPQIQAAPSLNGSVVVWAFVNTFRSRASARILRIVGQMDSTDAPTAATANRVMPIMRTRRCAASNVTGGLLIGTRAPWDTALNAPDDGIEIRCNPGIFGEPDTAISATSPGAAAWQQYTMRQATGAEQVLSQDNSGVPAYATSGTLIVNPGEALIIQQVAAIPTGGTAWFQVAWEEDQIDAGYVVGGEVTLSGSPVSGARVFVLTDSTTAMTAPSVEALTTGAPGTFARTVASGVKAAVFVQHEAGGTQYTDEGKPFIEGP
jgi:hypothetical protein